MPENWGLPLVFWLAAMTVTLLKVPEMLRKEVGFAITA